MLVWMYYKTFVYWVFLIDLDWFFRRVFTLLVWPLWNEKFGLVPTSNPQQLWHFVLLSSGWEVRGSHDSYSIFPKLLLFWALKRIFTYETDSLLSAKNCLRCLSIFTIPNFQNFLNYLIRLPRLNNSIRIEEHW